MAGVGPNVEDCLTEAATLDIEATPDGTVREIQEAGGLDRVDTQARWFSLRASTKANRKAISRTKRYGDMEWDTFLSYRVDADAELVKELYWQLRNMTITEHQKTRPLRVFWDRECLKDGEKWEEGFAKAICSSRLIVPVMSRNTFKMEKTRQSAGHNVEALTEDSPADNVLLEYELGLCLNELQGTAMMPLFVGDKDDSGKFSHFFESKCLPACGEVTVKIISEKVANYLARVAGVAREDLSNRYKPRSVRKILSEVTQFQGFFLQGPTYEAVRGAVVKVHACTNRLAQEHAERQQLDHLQFSTAQGEEVCQFLAEKTLSCYGSVLAKNRLSSLRKVSQLTLHQLDTLHQEFCAASSVAEDSSITQLGRRVALGEAVVTQGRSADKDTQGAAGRLFRSQRLRPQPRQRQESGGGALRQKILAVCIDCDSHVFSVSPFNSRSSKHDAHTIKDSASFSRRDGVYCSAQQWVRLE